MPKPPERILLLRSGRHVQVAVAALKKISPDCQVTIVSMPPGHFFQPLPFILSADGARAWKGRFDRVCVLWNDPEGVGQSNVDHTALCVSPLGFTAITADGTLIERRTLANLSRELGRAATSIGVAVVLGLFLYLPAYVLRPFSRRAPLLGGRRAPRCDGRRAPLLDGRRAPLLDRRRAPL